MLYQPALRPDQVKALYHLKGELKTPMTELARETVDRFLREIECKQEQAYRAGTTLSDWLAYERDIEEEAGRAAKQTAGLLDANAPF